MAELNLEVVAGSDDAQERESSGVVVIDGDLFVTCISHSNAVSRYWVAFRWELGATIPVGSTIIASNITPFVLNTYDDANLNIHFEKIAAPITFAANAFNITGRTRTAASTPWVADNVVPEHGFAASPSLNAPLQELVDVVSPTAIVAILRPNQNAFKKFYNRTQEYGDHTYGAKLHIQYNPPGVGYYHGLIVQSEGELALCDVGSHPLRIRKGGVTYGIELVAVDDPNASKVRIKTGVGVKAIRKYT